MVVPALQGALLVSVPAWPSAQAAIFRGDCANLRGPVRLCLLGSTTLDLGQDLVDHGVLSHRLAQSSIQPLE
jgi:hypothetical protein